MDICDSVLTFDRFMEEIDLEKYLKDIPEHYTGRIRYNPVSMLKTVLFGFMTNGYISLRELEDQCKVNLRFLYLMDYETPSYRTFGYFINKVLSGSIEEIFKDINQKIFETEHTDLQHLYIDGSKFEANANEYSWVWKKAMEKYMKFTMFKKETTDKKYHEDPFRAVNFPIDKEGIMRCPNGKAFYLKYRQSVKGNQYGRQEEVYECEDCAGCPFVERCKKTDKNRKVRINQELTAMYQEVVKNLESIQGALLRMNRSIQAEGIFGIMKNDH